MQFNDFSHEIHSPTIKKCPPNLKFGGHFFIESLPAIFLVVGIVIQISTDPCLGHASIQLHR